MPSRRVPQIALCTSNVQHTVVARSEIDPRTDLDIAPGNDCFERSDERLERYRRACSNVVQSLWNDGAIDRGDKCLCNTSYIDEVEKSIPPWGNVVARPMMALWMMGNEAKSVLTFRPPKPAIYFF
ncbi:MAG: hypothetical protein JSV66_19125 [Trueperaceae bacterium]|nr:MAG: hypothetical protein JSV66_19125 [Trueperaceae bacterium]